MNMNNVLAVYCIMHVKSQSCIFKDDLEFGGRFGKNHKICKLPLFTTTNVFL